MARIGRAQPVRPIIGRRQTIGAVYDSAISGPRYPVTNVNDNSDGGTAWTNPTQVISVNGGNASVSSSSYPSSGTNISQYLKTSEYGFNIDPKKSIVGIVVECIAALSVYEGGPPFPCVMTARLVKANGLPRPPTRLRTFTNTAETNDYTFGGALDSWDEPYTPAEINNSNFGVALRKEGGDTFIQIGLDAIRMTVYTTDAVLPVFTYLAGTYSFGPTAIASGKTSISFYLDATLHTDGGVTATVTVEISYDSGSNWEPFISATGAGGSVAGPSGVTEPRWWMRRDLPDSANGNRQYRGSLVISGGSLITSIGVFVN